MCWFIIIQFDIFSLTSSYEHRYNGFSFIFLTLESTLICETKRDEESHEERLNFINQDVKKNAISREQGKLSDR